MLAELLLVLAGHPSSFFSPSPAASPTTLALAPSLSTCLHPGEVASLDALGQLAFRYNQIRTWALKLQRRGRSSVLAASLASGKGKGKDKDKEGPVGDVHAEMYLSALAGSILDVLKDYEVLLLSTEAKVLALDPVLVQDQQGYVPLSALVATVSPWQAPLASLSDLITTLAVASSASTPVTSAASTGPTPPTPPTTPTPGELIHLLQARARTGDPTLAGIYTRLLGTLTRLFLTDLSTFLLHGHTPSLGLDVGPDPLSPTHRVYSLDERLVPPAIGQSTQESMVYIGRVAATLRREGRALPPGLVHALREELMGVKTLEDGDLDTAIQRARQEVGEWLWTHILTGPQVVEALDTLQVPLPSLPHIVHQLIKHSANFFLTRSSDYSLALVRELRKLHLDKLITSNPHSSSSVIREQDLRLALLRASVGTSVEADKALDSLRLKLPRGTLRPLLPSASSRPAAHPRASSSAGDTSIRELFSSAVLGAPMELAMTISWPLDLFLTPPTLAAYTDIHAYLFALRDTHARVLETWSSLSHSHRRRRKWTATVQSSSRTAWSLVRSMLFFLDELLSHSLVDVIDVQHRRLLEYLDGAGVPARGGASTPRGSLRGSTRQGSVATRPAAGPGTATAPSVLDGLRAGSPAPSEGTHAGFDSATVKSGVPPLSRSSIKNNYLDFLALRQMHARHLAFLREGLLIADRGMAVLLRDIMDVCRRLAGLVERWGGRVEPDLLEDHGSDDGDGGDVARERADAVKGLSETFNELLCEFFQALLETLNPPAPAPAAQGPGPGHGGRDASSVSALGFVSVSASVSRSTSVSGSGASGAAVAAGASFSRTARLAHMSRQTSFTAIPGRAVGLTPKGDGGQGVHSVHSANASIARAEAEASMGRHIEQLLLRLDFNGVLTDWHTQTEDDELRQAGGISRNVLAEGGL